MYYLQSRYYDPELGRFICSDIYTSTGQGLLGNNMFAYCGNNPICHIDPYGYAWWDDWWENGWNTIKDWLEKKKEDAASNDEGTTTVGFTGSAAFGFGGSTSLGITSDKKGNVGISFTINGGGGFPSAGAGLYKSTTNAPTIYKQAGWGATIGGSGGPFVVAAGAEYNMLIDSEEKCAYHGYTVSATYGFYPTVVEVHGEVGYTWVWGGNMYDVAIGIVDFMLGN